MITIPSLNFGGLNKSTMLWEGYLTTPLLRQGWGLLSSIDLVEKYKVLPWQEMRIDLVINSIYGTDEISMEATDIILHLNNIDNPLNIKAGMEILYPPLDKIDVFRYEESNFKPETSQLRAQLGKANKSTRTDNKRKAFVDNGYSLPPTVNRSPINPVRIDGNNLIAGGVK